MAQKASTAGQDLLAWHPAWLGQDVLVVRCDRLRVVGDLLAVAVGLGGVPKEHLDPLPVAVQNLAEGQSGSGGPGR